MSFGWPNIIAVEPGNNKKGFITMEEDEIVVVFKIKQKNIIHFQIKGKKC